MMAMNVMLLPFLFYIQRFCPMRPLPGAGRDLPSSMHLHAYYALHAAGPILWGMDDRSVDLL
jgi:hypothetical protein